MALVRYLGPHTEGVAVSVLGDAEEFLVMPDEVVDLPDRLVHGVPAVLDADGEIVTAAIGGLLDQVDDDGAHWERADGKTTSTAREPISDAIDGIDEGE